MSCLPSIQALRPPQVSSMSVWYLCPHLPDAMSVLQHCYGWIGGQRLEPLHMAGDTGIRHPRKCWMPKKLTEAAVLEGREGRRPVPWERMEFNTTVAGNWLRQFCQQLTELLYALAWWFGIYKKKKRFQVMTLDKNLLWCIFLELFF